MKLQDLPDEILHHIGSFIIANDDTLFRSYYGEFIRFSMNESFTCPRNRLLLSAPRFYLCVLGRMNRNMYDRVRRGNQQDGFFWRNNLFVWRAVSSQCNFGGTRGHWLYEKSNDDSEEDEDDEDTQNMDDQLDPIHSKELSHAMTFGAEASSHFLLLNSQCQFRKVFIQGHAAFFNALFEQTTQMMNSGQKMQVTSQPLPSMTPTHFPFQYLHELYLDTDVMNLRALFDMIVKASCYSLNRLHIMARRYSNSQEEYQQLTQHTNTSSNHNTHLPLTALRILCYDYGFNAQATHKAQSEILFQVLEQFLPYLTNLQEIYLPFWSPNILQLIATSCFQVKDLVLHNGALMNGSYDEALELICQNIVALERFIIWRSDLIGFYVEIGEVFFTRILDHFRHSLKEFSVATSLSRLSSLTETGEPSTRTLAIPSQLHTLFIENIEDHYYNSGTPFGIMNVLAKIISNENTVSHNHLENISINLRHYRLSNLDFITNNVKCLHLHIENTMEVITALSTERPHLSSLRDLFIKIHSNDEFEKLITALKTKFFLTLRRLELSIEPTLYHEKIDLFRLMKEVIQIEALEIITERQVEYSQRFSPFYRSQVSLNHVHRAIPTGDWQWDGHGLSNEHHSPISNLKEFSIFTSSLTLVKIIPQLPKLTRLCLQVTGNLEIQIFDMASIISCTLHDLKYLRIELQGISHSLSKSDQKYPISIMNNIEQCVLNVRSLFASNYEDIVGAIVLFYIISFRGLFSFSCLYNDAFVQPLLDQTNQSNSSVEELLETCLDKVIQDCIFEEKSDQTFMADLKEAFIKEMIEKAIER